MDVLHLLSGERGNSIQACFISRRVCRLVSSDATIDSLEILPNENVSHFKFMEALWNGEKISVDRGNARDLCKISKELDNDELNAALLHLTGDDESISLENCLIRLRTKMDLGIDVTTELNFIAAHFYEIDNDDLSELSFDELDAVLSRSSLTIKGENELLDFIFSLLPTDSNYMRLVNIIWMRSTSRSSSNV